MGLDAGERRKNSSSEDMGGGASQPNSRPVEIATASAWTIRRCAGGRSINKMSLHHFPHEACEYRVKAIVYQWPHGSGSATSVLSRLPFPPPPVPRTSDRALFRRFFALFARLILALKRPEYPGHRGSKFNAKTKYSSFRNPSAGCTTPSGRVEVSAQSPVQRNWSTKPDNTLILTSSGMSSIGINGFRGCPEPNIGQTVVSGRSAWTIPSSRCGDCAGALDESLSLNSELPLPTPEAYYFERKSHGLVDRVPGIRYPLHLEQHCRRISRQAQSCRPIRRGNLRGQPVLNSSQGMVSVAIPAVTRKAAASSNIA